MPGPGDLFAPAYVPGDPQSQAALAAWYAQSRPVGAGDIDALRMPEEMQAEPPGGGRDIYGGNIPQRVGFSDPRGRVSPDVLRAAAMGSPFNAEQRRNAIAERVARNRAMQEAMQQRQAQLQMQALGGAYGNPALAGQMLGQGLGMQMGGAGMPMPPPPRGY